MLEQRLLFTGFSSILNTFPKLLNQKVHFKKLFPQEIHFKKYISKSSSRSLKNDYLLRVESYQLSLKMETSNGLSENFRMKWFGPYIVLTVRYLAYEVKSAIKKQWF